MWVGVPVWGCGLGWLGVWCVKWVGVRAIAVVESSVVVGAVVLLCKLVGGCWLVVGVECGGDRGESGDAGVCLLEGERDVAARAVHGFVCVLWMWMLWLWLVMWMVL